MTYVRMLEDQRGDVVDIEHYCSTQCYTDAIGDRAYGQAWPCPERADYPQYCPRCGALSVPAIDSDDDQ